MTGSVLTSQQVTGPVLTSQWVTGPVLTSQQVSGLVLTSQRVTGPVLTSRRAGPVPLRLAAICPRLRRPRQMASHGERLETRAHYRPNMLMVRQPQKIMHLAVVDVSVFAYRRGGWRVARFSGKLRWSGTMALPPRRFKRSSNASRLGDTGRVRASSQRDTTRWLSCDAAGGANKDQGGGRDHTTGVSIANSEILIDTITDIPKPTGDSMLYGGDTNRQQQPAVSRPVVRDPARPAPLLT